MPSFVLMLPVLEGKSVPLDGHQKAPLLGRFDPHKPHVWRSDSFTDRLRVGSIVFVALDINLNLITLAGINRASWPSFVGSRAQWYSCGTGLHSNQERS
jgi:hypothetical protein